MCDSLPCKETRRSWRGRKPLRREPVSARPELGSTSRSAVRFTMTFMRVAARARTTSSERDSGEQSTTLKSATAPRPRSGITWMPGAVGGKNFPVKSSKRTRVISARRADWLCTRVAITKKARRAGREMPREVQRAADGSPRRCGAVREDELRSSRTIAGYRTVAFGDEAGRRSR